MVGSKDHEIFKILQDIDVMWTLSCKETVLSLFTILPCFSLWSIKNQIETPECKVHNELIIKECIKKCEVRLFSFLMI